MQLELTSSQREVVEFPYKPANTLKVIAGPGSGKTITLLHKVRHLIESNQVRPEEILILSLTNKAVDNIIDNLLAVFEKSNSDNQHTQEELQHLVEDIQVSTLHGLANKVVAENEGLISIIEENGWRGLIKLFPQDLWKGRNSKLMTTREFQRIFKEYKLGGGKRNEVMEKFVTIMCNCKVYTNEDLIIHASEYLEKVSKDEITEGSSYTFDLKKKYKVVLIDEFQDLFPSLLPLLEQVARGKQLVLFGDPNQSIYNFLGENKLVIDKLDNIHENGNFTVMQLYDNFRCTPEIMASADKLIHNKGNFTKTEKKNLVLKDPSGVEPICNKLDDTIDALEFLIEQICELICSGAKLSDIAILTKTNAHVQIIAEHLRSYGIWFQKLTAQPDWMSDARLQLLLDLLRSIVLIRKEVEVDTGGLSTRRSDFSILVTLSAIKGVGSQAVQNLYNVCNERNISLWNYISQIPKSKWPQSVTNKKKIEHYTTVLSELIDKSTLLTINDPLKLLTKLVEVACTLDFGPIVPEGRRDVDEFKSHLEEMLKVMKICAKNKPDNASLADWFLESYLEQGLILHHQARERELHGSGAVNISTIHSSKGLEFPIVFLMGGMSNPPMSRNLMYVGMTRARNLLYLNNVGISQMNPDNIKPDRPLRTNKFFWDYYNNDLKRPICHCPSISNRRYEFIRQKYDLNVQKRTITTSSYKSFQLCKRAIRGRF
ncbi:HMI1 (YOL095C) [Zygosaccharomyces parabailii]|nr:HMI1 (YOL095C) [Zygosaccharomyces parabailii]CDH12906.1 related to HMI1-Mitochondrial DNA helicase [Zygosaccharomyces bailii ISA1307]